MTLSDSLEKGDCGTTIGAGGVLGVLAGSSKISQSEASSAVELFCGTVTRSRGLSGSFWEIGSRGVLRSGGALDSIGAASGAGGNGNCASESDVKVSAKL